MGHAFQDTIMDALTRFHRMSGDRALWQPGTDHAGIATQMVVERQLLAEGKTRHALGREAFNERVWRWKEESGGTIARQMRRLGCSVDWSRDRFTMDPGMSQAVQQAFIRLYEEGLIYRGKRLVNWDPVLKTAVSDLEVASEEENGTLWHIRYPFADGKGHVTVATTRPETMLGDVAVAFHPDDERYRGLDGTAARAAAHRPHDSAARRRVRGPRLRHGLRQADARARLQRLRGRPAPRAAADQHPDRRREDQRRGARRATAGSTASRRASASSPTSRPRACSRRPSRTASRSRAATAAAP